MVSSLSFWFAIGASSAQVQEPPAVEAGGEEEPSSLSPVRYNGNGWPVVAGDAPVPTPLVEPGGTVKPAAAEEVAGLVAPPEPTRRISSGMHLDSPLHEVFRATRSPGAMRELGGVEVWWRLTVHGSQGEVIGVRELTHVADCRFAARDRIEHQDGRNYSRCDDLVSAQRSGIPYDNLLPDARAELELFGMHLRLPWCYGDGKAYAILAREVVERSGRMLRRLHIERRPPPADEVFGPELNPKPRDRFFLLYDPITGEPSEFVHRFARTGQERRVLLEDWREVGGVRMPFRRVYVDDAMRPTTTVELLRPPKPREVSERDFRLL